MMDKSGQSPDDSHSTNSTAPNSRDQHLKHLNKLSHKISKPIVSNTTKKPPFDNNFNHQPQAPQSTQQQQNLQAQQQQHQPPVYNINKNDFRDVVQKLTGSPAHERFATPTPIQPPKAPSSRLQRIRPSPLSHVSNRPLPLLNSAIPPPQQQPQLQSPLHTTMNSITAPNNSTNAFVHRPSAPLSPLPPFPSVHAAAESPVSAYMRYLQNSIPTVDSNKPFSGFSPLAPLVSPRWNNLAPQQPQHHFPPTQQGSIPSPTSGMIASQPQFQLPTSPPPFGCLNLPRSPYALLSPSLLLSPSAFPLSPTLPVPSPRWRGV